ncbi:hypothetical protein BLA29_004330, partial [Euroglyphus maynei]
MEIDANHGVIHRKGNSIIYDEKTIPLVDNFDFKRIPPRSSSMNTRQSSSLSYPKSINDKIKFTSITSTLPETSTSTAADRESFYEQVIPKLTKMIFNTRPSILNNDEETIVQYRSPLVRKFFTDDSKPPTVPTIRLMNTADESSTHRSSPSMTKRMFDDPNTQIQ